MAKKKPKKLIRGAAPLASAIFDDPRKRRLIKQLRNEGWPIFDLAGKPAGYLDQIEAKLAEIRQAARRPASKRRAAALA
jgi:hypothetical protein